MSDPVFLMTGVMMACFSDDGKMPVVMEELTSLTSIPGIIS